MRIPVLRTLLFLLLGLLVLEGCYMVPRTINSGDGDDDDSVEQDDDDDSVADDDDTSAADDDDTSASSDDDDTSVADDDDTSGSPDDDDTASEPTGGPVPAFVDDCTQQLNDSFADRAGLQSVDEQEYNGVQACAGEADYYEISVPAWSWLSVEVIIDGSGSGASDLDLYEVNPANEGIQVSWSTQNYERLSVYNDTASARSHYFAVLPYDTAASDYDILIRVSDWDEGLNCDSFYPSISPFDETGPCNRIMQVPRANQDADGWYVEHEAHYSNLRREVVYLISWAAEQTAAAFPGTTPLAFMDMSEDDGATPGTMASSLRHPEGTHIEGNDVDIAYYQTDGDNNGEVVCANDGYFCTSTPNILDAERTAYFMAQLFTSSHVRVIGVDTLIAAEIEDAADDLVTQGLITATQRGEFTYGMAYGDGWPFHHHHLHFSWDWEDGYERDRLPIGCMVAEPVVNQPKTPAFPMP